MLEVMKTGELFYGQRGVYKEGSGSTKYDRNVWRYDPVSLSNLAINPSTSPLISYLFGEIKRGTDGNFYIPNLGKASDKIHAYNGATFYANVICKNLTLANADGYKCLGQTEEGRFGLLHLTNRYNNYTYSTDTLYKLAASLPTQVFKVFDNSGVKEYVRSVGEKEYYLSDHLQSLRVAISDAKLIEDKDLSASLTAADEFVPEVKAPIIASL